MRGIVFSYCLLILVCISCKRNQYDKVAPQPLLDTIINYTKVDVAPSFKECDSLIDVAKTLCFQNQVSQRISAILKAQNFKTKDSIRETIIVSLLISKAGEFKLKETSMTNELKKQLPSLDSILHKAVQELPKVNPAIKRGIYVNTQYLLPIRIKVKAN